MLECKTRPSRPNAQSQGLTPSPRVAVARKLLLIAHAIYKTGELFCPPALKEA
jgi:hypothetical protein